MISFGPYWRREGKNKPDYVPNFAIRRGFVCLPLIFGNLYIMRGQK